MAGSGVVRTEAEKLKAEEELRKRKEAEEEAARLEQERKDAEEAARRKENSFWHKFMKKAKNFGEQMIKEEE